MARKRTAPLHRVDCNQRIPIMQGCVNVCVFLFLSLHLPPVSSRHMVTVTLWHSLRFITHCLQKILKLSHDVCHICRQVKQLTAVAWCDHRGRQRAELLDAMEEEQLTTVQRAKLTLLAVTAVGNNTTPILTTNSLCWQQPPAINVMLF